MKRALISCAATVAVVVAGVCIVSGQNAKAPVKIAGDFDKVKIIEAGGPAPRPLPSSWRDCASYRRSRRQSRPSRSPATSTR